MSASSSATGTGGGTGGTTATSGGVGGTGSGGAGGAGGVVECKTADDCMPPGDPRCGKATCTNGVCGLEVKPLSPLESQKKGDCKYVWCDGKGNFVEFIEASDIPNDGAECTTNSCAAGMPVSAPVPNGMLCPETGAGVCHDGECVACFAGVNDDWCSGNLVCDYTKCVPLTCTNNQWDPGAGEAALDCGGPCQPCQAWSPCNGSSDCIHNVCANGSCAGPTCSDGARNDSETGVDCGGPSQSCPRCPAGKGCKQDSDCESQVCWAGVCEVPSCTDGVLNGDEAQIDCGGSCAACP